MICELFQETEHPYNLWNNHTFRTYTAKTEQYGTEILLFMGPFRALENLNKKEVIGSQITSHVGYFKPSLEALGIYKAIAFLPGFILKKSLPQVKKVFCPSFFFHYFIIVALY